MKQRGEKEEITDRYPVLFPSFKMIMKMMTIRTERKTEGESERREKRTRCYADREAEGEIERSERRNGRENAHEASGIISKA